MRSSMNKNYVVWIEKNIITTIQNEIRMHFPKETGGILMGYWGNEEREIVINSIVGSGPNAVHEYNKFVPDHECQLDRIAEIYNESGRVNTYLGDWHIHPYGNANLSKVDKKTLKYISQCTSARATKPIMLILGGDLDEFKITVHIAVKLNIRFIKLFQYKKAIVKYIENDSN